MALSISSNNALQDNLINQTREKAINGDQFRSRELDAIVTDGIVNTYNINTSNSVAIENAASKLTGEDTSAKTGVGRSLDVAIGGESVFTQKFIQQADEQIRSSSPTPLQFDDVESMSKHQSMVQANAQRLASAEQFSSLKLDINV